jgi:hypothetical protein
LRAFVRFAHHGVRIDERPTIAALLDLVSAHHSMTSRRIAMSRNAMPHHPSPYSAAMGRWMMLA